MLPRERVRRIHPARLAQAYATGRNLDAAGHPERLPETESSTRLTSTRTGSSASSTTKSQRIRRLHARLRSQHASSRHQRRARATWHVARRRRREATFLDDVSSPRQLPTQLTMVLLRRPEYRAALEGYLEFRRTVSIHLDEPALDAPLENLPSLYETWGTLQVIKALADAAIDLGFTATEQLFRRDASGLFLRVLGTDARRSYSSESRRAPPSSSFRNRPTAPTARHCRARATRRRPTSRLKSSSRTSYARAHLRSQVQARERRARGRDHRRTTQEGRHRQDARLPRRHPRSGCTDAPSSTRRSCTQARRPNGSVPDWKRSQADQVKTLT